MSRNAKNNIVIVTIKVVAEISPASQIQPHHYKHSCQVSIILILVCARALWTIPKNFPGGVCKVKTISTVMVLDFFTLILPQARKGVSQRPQNT